ncbi:MAG: hypothetical protein ACFE94_10480 [Candidatus Hodarchaeota archaeon]
MKTFNKHKIRLKIVLLLSITLVIMLFPAYLTNLFNSATNSENIYEENNDFNDFSTPTGLKSSLLGDDPWWDTDFAYRRLITITNPYNANFTNFGVSLTFNYAELGSLIQSDLDDIRIVENGNLLKYYVVKDYPSTDLATVWFDTDILQYATESDTYLYFGNSLAGNAEASGVTDSFGWIKNGDFEFDTDTSIKFIPYGWNFIDDPTDYVTDDLIVSNLESYNNSETSYDNFMYSVINDPTDLEGVGHGDYAYKWGTKTATVGTSASSFDYVGTLYSYPFKVPVINDGTGKISLNMWRNVRTFIFERNKAGGATIDNDGYFIRLCNGTASKYTSDVDLHENIGTGYNNYIEAYGGYAQKTGQVYNNQPNLWEHFKGPVVDTSISYNDLTGNIIFDISDYMGEEIFLELGSWGFENGDAKYLRSGFFQVDYVGFNYTLTTSIEELQARKSDVTVIAKDVDGRIVPNTEIFIVNNSAKGTGGFIVDSKVATDGKITFTDLPRGRYNITANYTLCSQEVEVFNSSKSGIGPYYFNGIDYTTDIQLDLWTIDFEVVDWDGIPLKYGYIEINESKGGAFLDSVTLDNNGRATFRWLNKSSYYYKVFYDNEDYGDFIPLALNESYIYRSQYIQDNAKFRDHTINLNESSVGSFSVSERIYTNGSKTELSNIKILKANITLTDMQNYLEDVSIYYIDKDDSTVGNLIYNKVYSATNITDDFIELDITHIDNDNLRSDNFEVYGLLVEVNGFNSTISNGMIKLDLIESCNIYNRTALARLNLRVIENYGSVESPEGDPRSATIKVVDDLTGQPLVNLSSFSDRDGYAFSPKNGYETPFWFLIGRKYNFSLDIANITDAPFNITYVDPPQWIPGLAKINEYNYTLHGDSSITFNLRLEGTGVNVTNYDTAFNTTGGTSEAFWEDDISFWAEFISTSDNWQTWDYVSEPPGNCYLTIKVAGSEEILISEKMTYVGNGNFTITVNSGLLSAGTDKEYYDVAISGYHPTYDNPTSIVYLVKIKALPTIITAHDYDTRILILDQTYTTNFNELINITVKYSIAESGFHLENALLTYSWIGLDPITFYSDPLNSQYYTFTLNSSDAQSTGIKVISISASLENYTRLSFPVYLNILERKTLLNDLTELVYLTPEVWVEDTRYFTFAYIDANSLEVIGDLTTASYSWHELDENGNPLTGPGYEGTGTLIQNPNRTYYVDFNTELREVGEYSLFITMQKISFEARFAFINLEIKLREFDYVLEANKKSKEANDQIKVDQGDIINFVINLVDLSRNNISLIDAQVSLNIRGVDIDFIPFISIPGIYTLNYSTSGIDTFISSKTLTAKITIEMINFTTREIPITIEVLMEELFPGMPTFYFILITASVVGVVGSIVAYRVIQRARIPKHVKKIRKIKGYIKSKKKVSEISIPTKEEMTAKLFGDDWKELGLSIDETLGIQDLKTKKSSIKDRITKEGGENN